MRWRLGLTRDYLKKISAIAFQLFRTDARHPRHLIQRVRPPLRHFNQSFIVENHVSRHPRRLRQRPPFRPQGRQQWGIFFAHQRPHRRPSRGLHRVASKGYRCLTPQNRPCCFRHAQAAMPLGIRPHKVLTHHLPKDRGPGSPVDILPNPECRQRVMPALTHLICFISNKNICQMPSAKHFAGAQNSGQRLPDRLGPVERLRRCIAKVAGPTRFPRFPEIGQQVLPPTHMCLGQPKQSIQPPMIRKPQLRRGQPLVDLHPPKPHVIRPEQSQRFRGRPIAPGAANLLIIGLN